MSSREEVLRRLKRQHRYSIRKINVSPRDKFPCTCSSALLRLWAWWHRCRCPPWWSYLYSRWKEMSIAVHEHWTIPWLLCEVNSLCLASSRRSRTVNTLKLSLTTLFYLQGGLLLKWLQWPKWLVFQRHPDWDMVELRSSSNDLSDQNDLNITTTISNGQAKIT